MQRIILSILLSCLCYAGAWSQVASSLECLLGRGEVADSDSVAAVELSDSALIADMGRQLQESRLAEANLRLEIEQMRLQAASADSLRRARMQAVIDSLRHTTPGSPVVVEGDTLFLIYARSGGWTAPARAQMAAQTIEKIGKQFLVEPDSVLIDNSDVTTDLVFGSMVIVSLSDRDGLWAGCPRDSLAASTRQIVVDKLRTMNAEHGLWKLIRRCIYFVLIIIALGLVFKLINRGYRRLVRRIDQLKDTKLKPFYVQNLELLDTAKQARLLVYAARGLRLVVMAVVLILTVPLIFSIFPQTKDLAMRIFYYIWNPAYDIICGVVAYIPNLFTIFVICLVIRYLVRMLKYFAHEIADERLKFGGFYPDWAMPTFYIVRFLLYAFMIAMIYPYLPGSNSGIFQGISVFLGLIVSLGSSSLIGNLIAGLVITYMRPFKMGDRIQLKDTTGNVIEKTALVTRIRTPKNEVVTIPNSFVMSSLTVNYTQSAQQFGLILHTEVSFAYDVPWRDVQKVLIDAALNTPGVVDDPRPFVLQTQFDDWTAVYQLNAYVRRADDIDEMYSALHENIQEGFKRAGIDMRTPHQFTAHLHKG